ncbi:integrin beta-1-like [Amphiura filiformis]|uniref:integrin beta-1-like n=1 Tax=Amphiura filiformis TaxID=82378 RepID=UPI003B21B761
MFRSIRTFSGIRCDSLINLLRRGCDKRVSRSGYVRIIKEPELTDNVNSPTGQAVQLTPQEARVRLIVGQPQVITLKVRLANDYPLDVYCLMDLSYSMLQHLTNVAQLGDDLRILENSLGGDLHLGFGSFVDKPVLPFITSQDTCERDACCPGPLGCELPYSFKNHLPLTNETGKFSSLVAGANVSTGLDAPEGGLDALNQVAVCAEQIGWRNRSRRIVIFITDAIFHFAGDGKLAGISKPNDGECHLDPVTNEYTKSTDQDYPSVGHTSAQLHNKNIIPVFVVEPRMYELYQNLSQLFKGGRVGLLSVDSANVIDLLTHILYNNGDSTPSRCKETGVAEFDVEMLATDCSPNGEKQT